MAEVEKQKLIRLSKSCIGEAEKKAVADVLDREYLGMGRDVEQFEKALSIFFGRPAVCVANGTAALQLALQGCGIGPGDEVLVPSLTYVASFQAISATGARPVACDISPDTMVIDWRDAERRLTAKTKAMMPVHYSGGVGDLDGIYAFANRHHLRVIEDAAHAFGTTHRGAKVGSFGDAACFSFDGIKNITSGEGGCVVTDDPLLLEAIQDARLLGVRNDSQKRFAGERSWGSDVVGQGWRYHMSNVMAAIGLEQLQRFAGFAATRQRLARRYDERLSGHPRIQTLAHNYSAIVPHIYVVQIKSLVDRESLRAALLETGIQTGVHYRPNHMLTFYRDTATLPLPVVESVYPELLSLPLHPDLEDDDIDFICTQLKELLRELV